MRMFVACCICVFACAANAESGFLRAVFTGSGYDGTSVVSLENGATVVPEPTEVYASECPAYTTYAFVTYMILEPGETYFFKGVYDDYVTLKIDDEIVLKQGDKCVEVTGSYNVPNIMKWHKLDIRVSNDSGAGGLSETIRKKNVYGGILFKKGVNGVWTRFTSNDGFEFRTSNCGRKVFWNSYEVRTGSIAGELGFSQSDFDSDLVFASSKDCSNWSEEVISKLDAGESDYAFNVSVDPLKPFVRFGIRQGDVEDWSATLDLASAKDPLLGDVSHDIVFGENNVTFTIPVYALGSGAKKTKVYVRYGLVGVDDFKKTQVATISAPQTITSVLEGLIPEKEYQYTVIAQTAGGGYAETAQQSFIIRRKWSYTIRDEGIWINWVSPSCGDVVIPTEIDGIKVVGVETFHEFSDMTSLTIPEGVERIEDQALYTLTSLTRMSLPSTLKYNGGWLGSWSSKYQIDFHGAYLSGAGADLTSGFYSREFGADWLNHIDISTFKGYWQTNLQNVVIVSTAMRKNDPTVMDVRFKVLSEKPTVKVRVLAFEDGERSFAKVVRPVTFIDGTESSIGDSIAANQEHQLSWRVSADWKIDVAKVKFEVLAVEDDILPLELTTLPRIGEHPSIEYSWNVMEESRVLDALFWLYADGRAGLEITDGVLKNGGTKLADGTKLNGYGTIAYVYEGMGYRVLAGEELEHVKNISRLKLSPNGFRQYAVKTLE